VQYILNSRDHSQTGTTPYNLTFGDRSAIVPEFPPTDPNWLKDEGGRKDYASQLNQNLKILLEHSQTYQEALLQEKQQDISSGPKTSYVAGEFVFHRRRDIMDVETLTARNQGPFEVIEHKQNSNTVRVRDLIKNNYKELHMSELIRFKGTAQQAYELALTDSNQFVIKEILGYSGSPAKRTSMEFRVLFANGTISWLPYSEMSQTEALDLFVNGDASLLLLRTNASEVTKIKNRYKKVFINENLIGTTFFMNLRAFGASLYSSFVGIEDRYERDFYLKAKIMAYPTKGSTGDLDRKNVLVKVFGLTNVFYADAFFLYLYASKTDLPSNGTLIDNMRKFKAFKLSTEMVPSDDFGSTVRSE
jgi:hypothetical protein